MLNFPTFPYCSAAREKSCQTLLRLSPACFFLNYRYLTTGPAWFARGADGAQPGSHGARCLQSIGSVCCATRHAERGCNGHAHLTWKHKISSTSRSKRLEKLIFGFAAFLLLTPGNAVSIPVQLVTRTKHLAAAPYRLPTVFLGGGV